MRGTANHPALPSVDPGQLSLQRRGPARADGGNMSYTQRQRTALSPSTNTASTGEGAGINAEVKEPSGGGEGGRQWSRTDQLVRPSLLWATRCS